MNDHRVTDKQLIELKKIAKQAEKGMWKVTLRLFAMMLFFAVATIILGVAFVPKSPEFIVVGNAIGGILALLDAREAAEIVIKKFREDEKKILRGDWP